MPNEYDVRKELYEKQYRHYEDSISTLNEGLDALLKQHEALDASVTKVRAELADLRVKVAILKDVAKADGITLGS